MSEGGQLFLWGLRQWTTAIVCGGRAPVTVGRVLDFGEPKAFSLIAVFALLAARDADRPLTINPPCAAELSSDEWTLVRALTAERACQRGASAPLRGLIGANPTESLMRAAAAVTQCFAAAGVAV